jgi:hypothetical protein
MTSSSAVVNLLKFVNVLKLEIVKTWVVFILCWLMSIVGVAASFLILGSTIVGRLMPLSQVPQDLGSGGAAMPKRIVSQV